MEYASQGTGNGSTISLDKAMHVQTLELIATFCLCLHFSSILYCYECPSPCHVTQALTAEKQTKHCSYYIWTAFTVMNYRVSNNSVCVNPQTLANYLAAQAPIFMH